METFSALLTRLCERNPLVTGVNGQSRVALVLLYCWKTVESGHINMLALLCQAHCKRNTNGLITRLTCHSHLITTTVMFVGKGCGQMHLHRLLSDLTSQWRHNGHDGVSNHQPHHCLLNRAFRHTSKKISKLCVTGLCEGKSPMTGEFPAQRANNAENVSIWWRHHDICLFTPTCHDSSQNEMTWTNNACGKIFKS